MAGRNEMALLTEESMSVEAKAKVRARHGEAIAEFQKWMKANPKATRRRQIQMFDVMVDSAKLNEMLKIENGNTSTS
jgi:hypothetical protein